MFELSKRRLNQICTECILERYLACGEDTHALRLTSKLVDLRAGYAKWIQWAKLIEPRLIKLHNYDARCCIIKIKYVQYASKERYFACGEDSLRECEVDSTNEFVEPHLIRLRKYDARCCIIFTERYRSGHNRVACNAGWHRNLGFAEANNYIRRDIEVVITGLTRNQFALTRTRVRIPLSAPEKNPHLSTTSVGSFQLNPSYRTG